MRRKPPDIDFSQEAAAELEAIRAKVGQEVPLSMRYALVPRATLVSIDGDHATLLFPNGARLERVPLRDLVDDSGFWKR
jgi:hypothetical protein